MIDLPDFTTQKMYDYETFYHLTMNLDRLSKFVIHYEAMKIFFKGGKFYSRVKKPVDTISFEGKL